jgi:hypothetical protein
LPSTFVFRLYFVYYVCFAIADCFNFFVPNACRFQKFHVSPKLLETPEKSPRLPAYLDACTSLHPVRMHIVPHRLHFGIFQIGGHVTLFFQTDEALTLVTRALHVQIHKYKKRTKM